jgi:hypothetical protein
MPVNDMFRYVHVSHVQYVSIFFVTGNGAGGAVYSVVAVVVGVCLHRLF